jgi:putative ABC transport system ATP-binding protein
MAEADDVIRVKDVYQTYHLGDTIVHALRGVSLTIREGDFVFIIGPSGSGKTTLLDIIGALSHPTKGRVYLKGKDLRQYNDFQLSMLRRNKIGFVFQTFNLFPTLNVIDNVLMPVMPDGVTPEELERARALLKTVRLEHRLKHTPNRLSGGERQRVAIARALVNNPEVVLADEPTGELDSKTGGDVFNYMRKMNQEEGKTFVIVTHDTEYIKRGDTIFKLHDGKIMSRSTKR